MGSPIDLSILLFFERDHYMGNEKLVAGAGVNLSETTCGILLSIY